MDVEGGIKRRKEEKRLGRKFKILAIEMLSYYLSKIMLGFLASTFSFWDLSGGTPINFKGKELIARHNGRSWVRATAVPVDKNNGIITKKLMKRLGLDSRPRGGWVIFEETGDIYYCADDLFSLMLIKYCGVSHGEETRS